MWDFIVSKYVYIEAHPHIYVFFMFVSIFAVFSLFYKKTKRFNATDFPPQLNFFAVQKVNMTNLATSEVEAGLFIKDFTIFDVIHNNFVVDMIVWFEFNPALISLEVVGKFTFERGTILQKSEPEVKINKNSLFVKYNLVVQLSTNLDQHLFPINDHQLYFVLMNEYVSPTEMIFKVSNSNFSWSEKLYTADWQVSGKSIDSGYAISKLDQTDPSKNISKPRVVFTLNLGRAGMRMAYLIFLPIFLLAFLGQVGLVLNSDTMSGLIISLSVTSVTGLLAYRFVIDTVSPNVGYFMLTDYFYNLILGTSFVSFVINVMESFLTQQFYFVTSAKGIYFIFLQVLIVFSTYYLLFHWNLESLGKKKFVGKTKDFNAGRRIIKDFFTLENLKKYADSLNEYPLIDNANWLSPDYSSFNMKFALTFWKKLKRNFAFKTGDIDLSLWFAELCVLLMDDLLKKEKDSAFWGDFFLKMSPKPGSKYIIWGDLQGAFHSLVRDLNELKNQGVLNDDLSIVKEDHYFVFNGNALNCSAFVLETLTLIMFLMQKNAGKVFYLRGMHENKKMWKNYQLSKELEIKAKHLSKDTPPFGEMVENFFDTLPLALYLQSRDDIDLRLLRIDPSLASVNAFDEAQCTDFLIKKQDELIKRFNLKDAKKSRQNIRLDAIIKNMGISLFQKRKSLDFLLPENGAPVWSVLSAPTSTFQILSQFYNDTFAILDIKPKMNDWTLTILCQDVRIMKGFSSKTYNLVYGFEVVTRFQEIKYSEKKEIILGGTLDLSRTSAALGRRLYEGMLLGVMHQNFLGGNGNALLKLVAFDDQYTPYIARNNVLEIYNTYKTNLILSPLGTPTTESFLPMVQDKKILVLFPYTGAGIFRAPELTHMVHFRTSYANEARALVDYAVNILGVKRFAVFYQDDSYGRASLEGTIDCLKKHNISECLEAPYQRNRPQVEEAAHKIIGYNPNAILFFSTNAPSIALIKALGVHNLTDKYLLGISFLTDIFREYLKTVGLQLIISRVIPNINSKLEIVKEYANLMKKEQITPLSEDSLEGYINVSILVDVLNKIEGPVTKEKIIAEIEKIKNYNFKGLYLNFDSHTRELFKSVWIDIGNDEWINWEDIQ